jgi:hypothetical protein
LFVASDRAVAVEIGASVSVTVLYHFESFGLQYSLQIRGIADARWMHFDNYVLDPREGRVRKSAQYLVFASLTIDLQKAAYVNRVLTEDVLNGSRGYNHHLRVR